MWAPRFTLIAFSSTCLALSYMDRWSLSVAAPLLMREFGWDETRMGLLQSLFFYGFTLSHLPGGWLADRFGGRRVLGAGAFVWSLATGTTPLAGSLAGLGAVRIVLGLGEGVNMPSISSLVARGFPVAERTRATVLNLTGIHVGTLIALPLSAWIAATYGWRAIFSTYALVGFVWVACWFLWRPPERHDGVRGGPEGVPWRAILRHRPVWVLLGVTFVTNWTVWFFYSWLPTYFMQAHHVSLKESGLLSALPTVAMVCSGLASGWLSDGLILRGMPVTRVRKLVLASGFAGAAVLLLLLPQNRSSTGAVLCLVGALACFGLGASTVVVNSLDLAPAHAGVLVGLQGTAGNVAGMISPLLGGAVVAHTGAWDLNFYVIAALLVAGLLAWTRWASGDAITPTPARP